MTVVNTCYARGDNNENNMEICWNKIEFCCGTKTVNRIGFNVNPSPKYPNGVGEGENERHQKIYIYNNVIPLACQKVQAQ